MDRSLVDRFHCYSAMYVVRNRWRLNAERLYRHQFNPSTDDAATMDTQAVLLRLMAIAIC